MTNFLRPPEQIEIDSNSNLKKNRSSGLARQESTSSPIAVDQPPTPSDCAISHIAPICEHIPFIERCRKAIPPRASMDTAPSIMDSSVPDARILFTSRLYLYESNGLCTGSAGSSTYLNRCGYLLAYFLFDLSTDLKLRFRERVA